MMRRRRFWAGVAPFALLAAMALTVVALLQREDARAQSGLCDTDSAAVTAEELEFVAGLQNWRDHVFYPVVQLQLSEPLNKAAAWFAEYQVAAGAPGGHSDNLGRSWSQRAKDCGYDSYWADGSGEGIAAFASSQLIDPSPDDALGVMTAEDGGGVYIPPLGGSSPVKCVGVAKARSADGKKAAWVTVLAQYPAGSDCPGAGGTPDGSPTPTATATTPSPSPSASPSSTASPSPSASPSPTSTVKPPKYFLPLNLAPDGWALVTLPTGPIADVLGNAEGCFAAVYQLAGPDDWTRYAPDAPPYASNLTWSAGGAFWILGNGVNCGQIIL